MLVTLTPSDRLKLSNIPQGILALREVRRELRRPVRERNDAWLIACAGNANIEVFDAGRRVDVTLYTRHASYNNHLARTFEWRRSEALASDRTIRSAIRRALAVFPDIASACACSPVEWHA